MATAYISNFSTRYNWVILVHGTTTGENAKNELIKITEKEIGLEETVDKINSIYGNGSKINKKKTRQAKKRKWQTKTNYRTWSYQQQKFILMGKQEPLHIWRQELKNQKYFMVILAINSVKKMEKYYLRSIHLFLRVTFLFYLFVCAIFDTKFLEMYL